MGNPFFKMTVLMRINSVSIRFVYFLNFRTEEIHGFLQTFTSFQKFSLKWLLKVIYLVWLI